jgi:hypothetical protein
MAVVSAVETWSGREASRDASNVREYKRTFLVTCSSMKDGPFTVGTPFTGIPTLFSYYVDQAGAIDLGARVHKYAVRQRAEDPFTWEVDVLYTSAVGKRPPPGSGRSGKAEQADKGGVDDNPLNRPAVVRFQAQKFDKAFKFDKNGWPLRNFAGTPFQAQVIDDTRTIITIDLNRPALDRSMVDQYQDALNSDNWWGYLPKTCKMSATVESAFENGVLYWKYSLTIERRRRIPIGSDSMSGNKKAIFYQPNGAPIIPGGIVSDGMSDMVIPVTGGFYLSPWATILENQGPYARNAIGGDAVKQLDKYAFPLSPVLLDVNGLRQKPDDIPIYIVFSSYDFESFAALKLPKLP